MPPQHDPRKRLVETALKLFATRGYYHTSIADILRESGCTRGVLYYYFASKEELGYAAIDQALRQLFKEGAPSHLKAPGHPIDRLLKAFDALPIVTKLETVGTSVTDVSVRMASVHEGFRQRFQDGSAAIIEQVAEVVRSGVADGQIADAVDPHQLAHMYFTVAGGILYTKLLLDQEVIWEDTRRWMKDYLNSLRK